MLEALIIFIIGYIYTGEFIFLFLIALNIPFTQLVELIMQRLNKSTIKTEKEHEEVDEIKAKIAAIQLRLKGNQNQEKHRLSLPDYKQILKATTIHDETDYRITAQLIQKELRKYKIMLDFIDLTKNPKIVSLNFALKDFIETTKSGQKIHVADSKKFLARQPEIKRLLGKQSVRFLSVVDRPNVDVSIEIPVQTELDQFLSLYGCFERSRFERIDGFMGIDEILLTLGESSTGEVLEFNLCKAPHLVMGGSTGSGKSNALNVVINNLLYRYTPEEIGLILIDPKKVEFSFYEGIPHLLYPVQTELEGVENIFDNLVKDMDRRYTLLKGKKVRDISIYNKIDGINRLRRIICIVDEIADFSKRDDIMDKLQELLRKGRAVGFHFILASQRLDVDVLDGAIKANAPTKIGFKTSNKVESQILVESPVCADLSGNGDGILLFLSQFHRFQTAFLTEEEIQQLVDFFQK